MLLHLKKVVFKDVHLLETTLSIGITKLFTNTSYKFSKDLSTLWAWNKLLEQKTCQLSSPIKEFSGLIPKALWKEGESHSPNEFEICKLSGIKL